MSSKAAAVATVVIGGGSGAIGIAYLAGAFGPGVDYELPKKLNGFLSKDKGIEGCVLSTFPGIQSMEGNESTVADLSTASNKVESVFATPTEGEKMSGCLVVNWDKEKAKKQDKWKGTFRFLWSVKEGNKGFVVFAAAENKKDNAANKLNWNSIVYELQKSTNENKGESWAISKKLKKENSSQASNDLSNKFPGAGEAIEGITSKGSWGFLKENNQLGEICENDSCGVDSIKSSFRGYWTFESDSTKSTDKNLKKLEDWTSNLSEWWTILFGAESKWDMAKVVENKNVKWNKVFLEQPK